MSQANRCQAITDKGTQCSRNALPNEIYCTQHLKIYQPEEEKKILEESEITLIPDLEDIVENYIPLNEYVLLMKENPKKYTYKKYKKMQDALELEYAEKLESELQIKNQEFLKDERVKISEYKKLGKSRLNLKLRYHHDVLGYTKDNINELVVYLRLAN